MRRALDVGRAVSPPSEVGGGQGRAVSPPYRVYHITAPGPRAKINLKDAASASEQFGYQPTHDFSERWPQQTAMVVRDDQPWREVLVRQPMRARPITDPAERRAVLPPIAARNNNADLDEWVAGARLMGLIEE